MSRCPDIEVLEGLTPSAPPEVIDHVTGCLACQGVLALLETHGVHAQDDECARAEIYLAGRATRPLAPGDAAALEAHLAACDECRELASETPAGDIEDSPT